MWPKRTRVLELATVQSVETGMQRASSWHLHTTLEKTGNVDFTHGVEIQPGDGCRSENKYMSIVQNWSSNLADRHVRSASRMQLTQSW